MKRLELFLTIVLLSGCAGTQNFLGTGKLAVPPEFDQKVLLYVSDEYVMHQAPQSTYDIGDLQAFHSQHTLPIVVEDTFKEIFRNVEMIDSQPKIETGEPDVPAIFEVRILDMAHDLYTEATTYRSQVVMGVAMKSPRGTIFWQKSFRGEGYATVDPQFSTGLGPEQAILDAMRDVLDQIQKAVIASPEVRTQLRYYQAIDDARKEKEITV